MSRRAWLHGGGKETALATVFLSLITAHHKYEYHDDNWQSGNERVNIPAHIYQLHVQKVAKSERNYIWIYNATVNQIDGQMYTNNIFTAEQTDAELPPLNIARVHVWGWVGRGGLHPLFKSQLPPLETLSVCVSVLSLQKESTNSVISYKYTWLNVNYTLLIWTRPWQQHKSGYAYGPRWSCPGKDHQRPALTRKMATTGLLGPGYRAGGIL